MSVDDRGYLFADGIYEVTVAYSGRFFRVDRHLERMRAGLASVRIDYDVEALPALHEELLARNDLRDAEAAIVYVQVTRGVAPRAHAFPKDPVTPAVYAYAKAFHRPDAEVWDRGFRAITVPDRRWARLDIKSIALLPNVLAQQAAVDAGVEDAIFVRDGVAIEGAHSNLFAVVNGTLVTHPATHQILAGITRGYVLDLAAQLGIPIEQRSLQVEDLYRADEVFFSGTTTEVRPTVEVDRRLIGGGRVGIVTRRLAQAFREGIAT